MDRVQVLKQESAALGGDAADEVVYPDPIEPQEDAIEAAGVYFQDASNRDETTLIDRSGNDMRFKDGNNTSYVTLSDLLAGAAGLTESGHRTLRQLIHFIDEGPAEGFTSGAYREQTPSGSLFPTSIIWYESSSKTNKIVEKIITRSGGGATNLTPTPIIWKMYDTDGSTVLVTVSDAVTYSGIIETSRTRTITIH
jgi:hypothetical protein